jgi:SEC-C motif-containing protein
MSVDPHAVRHATATDLAPSPDRLPADAPCPCGGAWPATSPRGDRKDKSTALPPRYADCCGRYLDRGECASSALELMRSRYTAYTLEAVDYLRATWDPATCPADLGADERAVDDMDRHTRQPSRQRNANPDDAATPRWLGLDIRSHWIDDDTHQRVEFIARYKIGGRAHRLHEISRFTLAPFSNDIAAPRWHYVDGDLLDS